MADSHDGYAVPTSELARIWSAEPSKMEAFLNDLFPKKDTHRTGDGEASKIQMQCPFHPDTRPSAALLYEHRNFKCLSASCQRTGHDIVRVFSDATNTPYNTMYTKLMRGLGLKPKAAIEDRVREYTHVQQVMEAFVSASSERLINALANPNDPQFAPDQKIIAYNKARNVDVEMVARRKMMGAVPTLREVYAALPSGGTHLVPIIQKLFGESFFPQNPTHHGPYTGYIVFPYHTDPGVYGKIKLRSVPAQGEKARSLWVGKGLRQGFYGIPFYKTLYANQNETLAYDAFLVEGEYDALASYAYQYNSGNISTPTFAVSGAGADELRTLYPLGVRAFVFVPDYDAGGEAFVRRGLAELSGAFTGRVFDWEAAVGRKLRGADPHDVLLGNRAAEHAASFFNALVDPGTQLDAYGWALRAIREEASTFRDQHERDPGLKEIGAIVDRYFPVIGDPRERTVFVEDLAEEFGLDVRRLRVHVTREVVDDETFGIAVAAKVRERITPLFREGKKVHYYIPKTKRLSTYAGSKKDTENLMYAVFGADPFYQVRREVGLAPEYTTVVVRGREQERSEMQQRRIVTPRIAELIHGTVWSDAENKASGRAVSRNASGLHFLRKDEFAYFANGPRIWRTVVGEPLFRWEPVEGVYDEETATLFEDIHSESWCGEEFDPSTARMLEPSEVEALYETLVDWFSAWVYAESPEVYAHFLAAYALCVTFSNAFDMAPALFVSGQTQAGKSTLTLGVLADGGVMPGYHLLQHAYGMTDYSSAAVWQRLSGNPRLAVLDEFESEVDTRKGNVVHNLLEQLRDVSRGADLVRGTRTGTPVIHRLHAPVILSGIKPLRRIQDANRFIAVPLLASPVPPAKKIMAKYTREDAAQLRTALLQFAVTNGACVLSAYRELQEDLREDPLEVDEHRAVQLALGPAAVWHYLGLPWREKLTALVKTHADIITQRTATPERRVFSAVTRLPFIFMTNNSQAYSMAQIAINPTLRNELNAVASAGVYYYPGLDAFVVDPVVVRAKLARIDAAFRHLEPSELKALLRSHPEIKLCRELGAVDRDLVRKYHGNQALRDFLVVPFITVIDSYEASKVGDIL